MRWLAVDYGVKRIGLALGDDTLRICSPADTLAGSGSVAQDAAAVLRWADENAVAGFVVGLPLNMDGSIGPQAALSQRFVEALREKVTNRPVEMFDERLTSFAADQLLAERGISGRQARGRRDALAALVLLQTFFARTAEPDPGSNLENNDP